MRGFGCGGHYGLIEGATTAMLVFKRMTALAVAICGLLAGLLADLVEASAQLGQPFNWQMNLQQSATPVMDEIVTFHTILLWVIALITAFVLVLLAIIAVRFNAKSNPTPSRTTHNAGLEIAWTVVPVIILVLIAIPSFRLLFFQLNMPPADLTVKPRADSGTGPTTTSTMASSSLIP